MTSKNDTYPLVDWPSFGAGGVLMFAVICLLFGQNVATHVIGGVIFLLDAAYLAIIKTMREHRHASR